MFDIDGSSGQLKTKTKLDFETKSKYTAVVNADDGNRGWYSVVVTIKVIDVREPPLLNPQSGGAPRAVPKKEGIEGGFYPHTSSTA